MFASPDMPMGGRSDSSSHAGSLSRHSTQREAISAGPRRSQRDKVELIWQGWDKELKGRTAMDLTLDGGEIGTGTRRSCAHQPLTTQKAAAG